MGRVEHVSITCVGCQFNPGSKALEETSCEADLETCLQSIELIPQPDNKFNPRAIAWVWIEPTDNGYDEFIIGFVPDDELDEVWELVDNYTLDEVPSDILHIKRTNRGEIQWIQFGCVFGDNEVYIEEEEDEPDMGVDDNMSFSGFNRR